MRSDALLLVLGKRFKVERPLVAEAVVHALAPDLHRLDQVACRGRGKALRPEDGHCSFQHLVAIEFSRPDHGWHLTLLWTDVSITIGRGGMPRALTSVVASARSIRLDPVYRPAALRGFEGL